MRTYEEIFDNYIREINNKTRKLLNLEYITSVDNDKAIFTLNCLKNRKHNAYYDHKANKIYCPHCGYSLNLIELTADILNITAPEALFHILTLKLGYKPSDLVELMDYIRDSKKEYDLYYEINEKALELFRKDFLENKKAQEYAYKTRQLTNDTLDTFQIGSCGNNNLILDNLSKTYSLEDLKDVGLLGYNEEQNQYYDTFRNRLMFPIFDEDKRIVGFGGRTLGSSPSKYLNTKTTPIFQKGKILYSIDKLDKESIYDKVLVSEGYMDVVTMYQYGITNVVGNLGTAITKEHLQLLSRYTDRPVVMLDGDEAGVKAMKRTIEKVGKVDTVILPDNLDPDEYLKEYSADSLITCINKNIKSWSAAMKDHVSNMEGNMFENMFSLKQF